LVHRQSAVLPTLPEVIEALGGEPRLMLDLKGLHRGLAAEVAGVLAEVPAGAKVAICTQHWWMLDAFAAHPDLRLLLSAGSRRGLRRLRARLRQRSADGVCVRIDLLTPSIVDELRCAADIVLTWPVDTQEALQNARRLGVGGVISKNLDVLREVIAWR
jgi:glycerophosphoryl diester phosphodiesterase